MQWGSGKVGLDRVLDNNSGQTKTCLQVIILLFLVTIVNIAILIINTFTMIITIRALKVEIYRSTVSADNFHTLSNNPKILSNNLICKEIPLTTMIIVLR